MTFLAGTAASAALDLISSLNQTANSGKSKTSKSDAVFGMAAAVQPSVAETGSQKAPSQPVTSGTMRLMLSLQAHGVDMSSKIFDALDADGSGGVSKSEFEQIFAKNGDTQRADTVFDKLDTDHDGTVNTNELTSGLETERGRHDGDGSSVTTRPAAASSATDKFIGNYLERLIQRQAEMLTPTTTGQSMAVSA